MIKLSKTDINSLILKYLEEEGYHHTAFSFKSEGVIMNRNIIIDIDIITLVSMGLQFKYGVDHYINNKIVTCNVDYSIIEQHNCDVVKEKFCNNQKHNGTSGNGVIRYQKSDVENKNNHVTCKKMTEDVFDFVNENATENKNLHNYVNRNDYCNDITKKESSNDENFLAEDKTMGVKKSKLNTKNGNNLCVKEDEVNKDIIYGSSENKNFGDSLVNNCEEPVKDNNLDKYDVKENTYEVKKETLSRSSENNSDEDEEKMCLENIDIFSELCSLQNLCFEERVLSECKEAEIISWNGDYLAVKTVSNDLFAFRFGNFLWRRPIEDVSALLWFNDRLITGHFSGRLSTLNTTNYRKKVYEKHSSAIVKIFFDGKRIYSCSLDGTISTDDNLTFKMFDNGVRDALLVDSSYIVCSSVSGNLSMLDLSSKGVFRFDVGNKKVRGLSYDGKSRLSISTADGLIGLFGIFDKTDMFYSAHEGFVSSHAWIDGKIISAGDDKKVKLWDLEKEECLFNIKTKNMVKHIKTISNLVVMSSTDNYLRFFDERVGYVNKHLLKNGAKDFEVSPLGSEICVMIEDSFPTILNLLKL